jgi:hypothetical protein
MFAWVAPPVNRPVNVALVIVVGEFKIKSSALSISIFPPDEGREPVAINPFGSPVLKKTESAEAGTASSVNRDIARQILRNIVHLRREANLSQPVPLGKEKL